jgi:RNA polymerase sigma-70 factor, ECF subfamily
MTSPARSHLVLVRNVSAPAGAAPAASAELRFAELFRRHAPYVAAIGLKLLGRDDELDDLVQEVFIEAHRGWRQLRNVDAPKAWLARIAVRRAVRRLRRRKLRAFFSLDAVADDVRLIDPAATPEERAHVTSTYRILDGLPVAQRIAWVLKHVEGETLDSIAVLCACSKTTVQRRIRAAQETLAQWRRHD